MGCSARESFVRRIAVAPAWLALEANDHDRGRNDPLALHAVHDVFYIIDIISDISIWWILREASVITSFQMRAARALLGIDQKTLAELAGVSLPTIQRMEASTATSAAWWNR